MEVILSHSQNILKKKKDVFSITYKINCTLLNINDYNSGDDDYMATEDNGGYFIGGEYIFSGVSAQNSQIEEIAESFRILLGVAITPVGWLMSIQDLIDLNGEWKVAMSKDFREILENDKKYSLVIGEYQDISKLKNMDSLLKIMLAYWILIIRTVL